MTRGRAGIDSRSPVLPVLLVVAALATYANSIGAGFVWDDEQIVVAGVLGPGRPTLGQVLVSPDEVKPYYRPLNRASYLLDAAVWGPRPAGFHAVNVALQVANVLALFLLVRFLFADAWLAFWSALLLAVHPINAETVSFVSARNNLLALLLLQGAVGFLALAAGSGKRWAAWLSGLSWFLALASKESAAAGALLLVGYVVWPIVPARDPLRRRWSLLAPHALFLATYLGLRAVALEGLGGGGTALRPLGEMFRINFAVLPRYVELIVLPVRLNVFHPDMSGPISNPAGLALAWVAIVGGLVFLLRQRSRPSIAGLTWFAVSFLPVANLVVIPSATMAERFLYLPAVGLWVVAADQGLRLSRRLDRPRTAAAVAGLAACLLGARTIARNQDWTSDVALFGASAAQGPDLVAPWFNLGTALRDQGDLDGARRAWERALGVNPRDPGALGQLGTLAAVRGDLPAAEAYYRSALASKDADAAIHLNLAKVLERTGRSAEAASEYRTFLDQATSAHQELVPAARAAVERLARLPAAGP